ncbi:MAG: hypothetical protein ACTSU5_07240 [Promethearchaeota archaeon]
MHRLAVLILFGSLVLQATIPPGYVGSDPPNAHRVGPAPASGNPFAGDSFYNSSTLTVDGNATLTIPVNSSYTVGELNASVRNFNQTIEFIENRTTRSSPEHWAAQNETDITYRWNKTAGDSQILEVNFTGSGSTGPNVPLNRSTGVEEFWSWNGWYYSYSSPDLVYLDHLDVNSHSLTPHFQMKEQIGTRTARITKAFDYAYTGALQDPSVLTFDYYLYNYSSTVELNLSVILTDPNAVDHRLWSTTTPTGSLTSGASHTVGRVELAQVLTQDGQYNVTFETKIVCSSSSTKSQNHGVRVDNVELNLTQPLKRVDAGRLVTWNQTLPVLGTPNVDAVNASFSFEVSQQVPGVNFTTSRVGLGVNGTWVPLYSISELQPFRVYHVPKVTFPASLFGGSQVGVYLGVEVGENYWEVLPDQNFTIQFFNVSCVFEVRRDPGDVDPVVFLPASNFSIRSFQTLADGVQFFISNDNLSRWGVGQDAVFELNLSASTFEAQLVVEYKLDSWRQRVYPLVSGIVADVGAYWGNLLSLVVDIFGARWNKETCRDFSSKLVQYPWPRSRDFGVTFGPRGVEALEVIHDTLEVFASERLFPVNLSTNATFHSVHSLFTRYFDDVIVGGANRSTFFGQDLEVLTSPLEQFLADVTSRLSDFDPGTPPGFDVESFYTTLYDVRIQVGDLLSRARNTVVLPHVESTGDTSSTSSNSGKRENGTVYFGNSLYLYNASLNSGTTPVVPLSFSPVQPGGVGKVITSSTVLPVVISTPNDVTTPQGALRTLYLSSEYERELLAFLASTAYCVEKSVWASFTTDLGVLVNSTLGGSTPVPHDAGIGVSSLELNYSTRAVDVACQISGLAPGGHAWVSGRFFYGTTRGPVLYSEVLAAPPSSSTGAVGLTHFLASPVEIAAVASTFPGSSVTPSPLLSTLEAFAGGSRTNLTAVVTPPPWLELNDGSTVNWTSVQFDPGSREVSTGVSWDWDGPTGNFTSLYSLSMDPGVDLLVFGAGGATVGSSNSTREVLGGAASAAYTGQLTSIEGINLSWQGSATLFAHSHGCLYYPGASIVATSTNVSGPQLFAPPSFEEHLTDLKGAESFLFNVPVFETTGITSPLNLTLQNLTLSAPSGVVVAKVTFFPGIIPAGGCANITVAVELDGVPATSQLSGTLSFVAGAQGTSGTIVQIPLTVVFSATVELRERIVPTTVVALLVLFGAVNAALFVARFYKLAVIRGLKLKYRD